MAGEQLTGEDVGDGVVAVERHVQVEAHARQFGDRSHAIVDRIALGNAPRRLRVSDARRRVQLQHRLERRQAGRHHLRAAGKSGEEVRLDETRRDADVLLQKVALDVRGNPRFRNRAETAVPTNVEGVVLLDLQLAQELGAKHL